ncbi:hypothetical protein LCGC14_1483320, partial [marine sediment metagenome]
IGLCMVMLWTVGCCFMVAAGGVRTQHLLMVIGFGAIMTVFLLQFPRLFLGCVLVLSIGTGALMLLGAPPDDHPVLIRGLLLSLLVVVPLILLALWLHWRPMAKGEQVIVYACVVIAIPWAICVRAVVESSAANLFESQRTSEPQLYAWARDLPWWAPAIQPDDPAALAMPPPADGDDGLTPDERLTRQTIRDFGFGNGGNVPWRLWAKPIAYWVAMCLAWQGMLMGLLLMFRKRFIEQERLPFVWAQPAISIIQGPESGKRPRSHWVLFAIGLAMCLPSVIFMSPMGEAMTTWGCLPWAGDQGQEGIRAGVDLTGLNLLPGTQMRLWWGPLVLTMFLLFPLDVLMTTALAHILLAVVLPGLMRSFGISVGPNLLGTFVKNALRFGGAVGLLFWSVWFNRKTFWGYIRSLWGGKPTDSPSADEIPRKLVLLIFVGGTVGFVALGCHATSALQMTLLTLLVLVYSFSQVRLRISGLPLTYDNNFGSHQMVSIQRPWRTPTCPSPATAGPSTGCSGASTGR